MAESRNFINLTWLSKIGFGFGHVLNDITATLWFGYGLVYMQDILRITKANAGYVILWAQLVDAVFNLWVGNECDKVTVLGKYGRRKGWHVIGTVLIIVSMMFNYTPPFEFEVGVTPEWQPVFHMMSCQTMFNMGWAIVQIAHLSMIPTLARTDGDVVQLNSIRQGNVYFASILVYLLAGILIKNSNDGFQWSDRWSIMYLTYISLAVGFLAALGFHALTPEMPSSTPVLEATCSIDNSTNRRITWREWFKKPGFYRVCFCYTMTRLVYNMTLLFFPLLLSTAMRYPMNYIGYCPLVLYLSGLIYSLGISWLIKISNKKIVFCFSTLCYIGAAIWLEFLKTPNDQIWPIAILIGASSSGILILALASIVDVVGENKESSSFVYGIYSVIDKSFNGIGAVVIQLISPCNDDATQAECTDGFGAFFGRMMIVFTVLACITYMVLPKFNAKESADDFDQSHMNSVIISNRFQRSINASTLVYSLRNDETRPLLQDA